MRALRMSSRRRQPNSGVRAMLWRFAVGLCCIPALAAADLDRPHVVLVMADDMGWGETGYNGHPVLRTPHLDAMAANGVRFERFYAGAPVCSPTRATVLTGRSNDRTGVEDHGYALRRQEKTVARALRDAGYATAHFGKWHLSGLRGAGVPVLAADDYHPGVFGFDEWLSVTNYFDRNPILGRVGGLEEFAGDSSEIIADEALKFIGRHCAAGKPTFTVIWYGSPHHPARAAEADMTGFAALDRTSQHHYGELVAMDRSIGTLRRGLRELGIAENTMVWFCSDNGGLPEIAPTTVGPLRDFKGSLYEGGLRVPAMVEWPSVIKEARVTRHPAATMDIFPTLADIVRLPPEAVGAPCDGVSLRPLFDREIATRAVPIAFRYLGGLALIDNRYKLVSQKFTKGKFGPFSLFDLETDPRETKDLAAEQPEVLQRMRDMVMRWNESVEASAAGRDYPGGKVDASHAAKPRSWSTAPEYQRYLPQLLARPEFRRMAERQEPR
jgi:arylsulfatase A-like enzyme